MVGQGSSQIRLSQPRMRRMQGYCFCMLSSVQHLEVVTQGNNAVLNTCHILEREADEGGGEERR